MIHLTKHYYQLPENLNNATIEFKFHMKLTYKQEKWGKRVNNNKKLFRKGHCFFSGHLCSFDDSTLLNYQSHKFKRLIEESLLVTKDKSLNKLNN